MSKKKNYLCLYEVLKGIAIICILLIISLGLQAQQIKKIKITDLEAYIHNSDHPLIVNFWATFCVPCVKEIPDFQAVAAKYKNNKVELLLVSLDLPDYYPGKISAFAKEKKITAPIAWLNETDADYFCPKIDKNWSGGIPSTLFINNMSRFRRFYERELTPSQLEENIKAMIANLAY